MWLFDCMRTNKKEDNTGMGWRGEWKPNEFKIPFVWSYQNFTSLKTRKKAYCCLAERILSFLTRMVILNHG